MVDKARPDRDRYFLDLCEAVLDVPPATAAEQAASLSKTNE